MGENRARFPRTRVRDTCMPDGGSSTAYLRLFAPRFDDTSKRFISRDMIDRLDRSSFVLLSNKGGGLMDKNDRLNIRLRILPFQVYGIFVACFFYSSFFFCLQVRRATEAVQRLCQCPSEKCSKLKVRKVGEGRYHIAGRNVFIRVRIYPFWYYIYFI